MNNMSSQLMAPDRIPNKKGNRVNSCQLVCALPPFWTLLGLLPHTPPPPSPTPLLKKRFSTNPLCNTKGFWEAKRSSLYILDPLTPPHPQSLLDISMNNPRVTNFRNSLTCFLFSGGSDGSPSYKETNVTLYLKKKKRCA